MPVSDYESEGRMFESCRVHHQDQLTKGSHRGCPFICDRLCGETGYFLFAWISLFLENNIRRRARDGFRRRDRIRVRIWIGRRLRIRLGNRVGHRIRIRFARLRRIRLFWVGEGLIRTAGNRFFCVIHRYLLFLNASFFVKNEAKRYVSSTCL
jgi:hypothetical protein